MMMHVTTGVSSRPNASASTPPTDFVSPNLANSRMNWIVKTMPTNADVSRHTPNDFGPTTFS